MKDYEKYRWFVTSRNNLVVGGKSAQQNEELLKKSKEQNKNYIVMHTSLPGSPFSVILENIKKVTSLELEETAVFTACFSRAWRLQLKKAQVDVFTLSQLYKTNEMKTGTFGVKPPIKKLTANLELVLTKQKGKLRAVPEKTVGKSQILLKIKPGKIDKTKMLEKIRRTINVKVTDEELLSALPPGGVSIAE